MIASSPSTLFITATDGQRESRRAVRVLGSSTVATPGDTL